MSNYKDGFSVDTIELAGCAEINFQNCERMVPGLKQNPMWQLAMSQLKAAVARLEDGVK